MQHEAELVAFGLGFVLEDHPPIGVVGAGRLVLAAHEGKAHRARVIGRGRGARAADAASLALRVAEAVPIGGGRREPGGQHAHGPVVLLARRDLGVRDDGDEAFVARDFQEQGAGGLPPRPQDHAVRRRIARRHALRIKIAPLVPLARPGLSARPRQHRAQGGGAGKEPAPVISCCHCDPLPPPA